MKRAPWAICTKRPMTSLSRLKAVEIGRDGAGYIRQRREAGIIAVITAFDPGMIDGAIEMDGVFDERAVGKGNGMARIRNEQGHGATFLNS